MTKSYLTEVAVRAEQLAAHIGDSQTFAEARTQVDRQYLDLLDAVRESDERFAFDRAGRPGAIGAVREALPAMERDLFDAVLEDHACELAAVEEALYQVARACARAPR